MHHDILRRFVPGLLAAVMLACAGGTCARGGVPDIVSTDELLTKSEIMAVGEAMKVETVSRETDAEHHLALVRCVATVKVLRGIKTADATPLAEKELQVTFLALDPAAGAMIFIGNPSYQQLRTGQVVLLPLKREKGAGQEGANPRWQFVREHGDGVFVPAMAEGLADKPATARDFLIQELAAPFVNGKPVEIALALAYIQRASFSVNRREVTDALAAVLRSRIKDSNRWAECAVVAYLCSGSPGPALGEPLPPATPGGFVNSALSLYDIARSQAKANKTQDEWLQLMVEYQGVSPYHVLSFFVAHRELKARILELEFDALKQNKSGALAVALAMIKEHDSPYRLAGSGEQEGPFLSDVAAMRNAAREAARRCILRAIGQQEEPLLAWDARCSAELLFSGTDDDLKFAVEYTRDPKAAPWLRQNILAGTYAASARAVDVGRAMIDDVTVCGDEAIPNLRFCDVAGEILQRASGKDFSLKRRDPVATRDRALDSIRHWLAGQH